MTGGTECHPAWRRTGLECCDAEPNEKLNHVLEASESCKWLQGDHQTGTAYRTRR